MGLFEFECEECEYEWEEVMSWKDPIPSECPECKTEGKVRKLISLPSPGVVELTKREFKEQLNANRHKLKNEVYRNENLLANVVGEDKYQGNTTKLEADIKEVKAEVNFNRPKIKTKKS